MACILLLKESTVIQQRDKCYATKLNRNLLSQFKLRFAELNKLPLIMSFCFNTMKNDSRLAPYLTQFIGNWHCLDKLWIPDNNYRMKWLLVKATTKQILRNYAIQMLEKTPKNYITIGFLNALTFMREKWSKRLFYINKNQITHRNSLL